MKKILIALIASSFCLSFAFANKQFNQKSEATEKPQKQEVHNKNINIQVAPPKQHQPKPYCPPPSPRPYQPNPHYYQPKPYYPPANPYYPYQPNLYPYYYPQYHSNQLFWQGYWDGYHHKPPCNWSIEYQQGYRIGYYDCGCHNPYYYNQYYGIYFQFYYIR